MVAVAGLMIFGGDADDAASSDPVAADAMEPVDVAADPQGTVASPPVPSGPVDRAISRRAATHYRLATRDEGAEGALVYSRNCYAGLKSSFSWRRLDACGAFDAAAVGRLAVDMDASIPGGDWLESEAAAGRYLAAAIAAGMPPADADVRLSALQVAARAPVRSAVAVAVETEEATETPEPALEVPDVAADVAAEPGAKTPVPEPTRLPDADEGAPLDPA